nr:DUF1559 domain-containing protein [Armatimonadota bacterium]
SCMSNLKQMGLALLSYAQDYDELFPSISYITPSGTTVGLKKGSVMTIGSATFTPNALMPVIDPYIKTHSVFACPEDPAAPRPSFLGNLMGTRPTPTGERSYLYSGPINTAAHHPDPSTGLVDAKGLGYNISVLNHPADTVAMVEAWGGSVGAHKWDTLDGSVLGGCDTWKIAGRQPGDASGAPPGCSQFANLALIPTPGHFGTGNVLYTDGHVNARSWSQLKQNDFAVFKR